MNPFIPIAIIGYLAAVIFCLGYISALRQLWKAWRKNYDDARDWFLERRELQRQADDDAETISGLRASLKELGEEPPRADEGLEQKYRAAQGK